MKILARIFILSALIVSFAGCDDDDEDGDNTTTFTANLNGASEVPPNLSDATGIATLIFNEDTNKATLTVPYTGITATDAHIHKGAVGVSGPAVFPINVTASPLMLSNFTLTSQQEADLKNGLYYVNIHSAAYPDGEIRGQLTD
jgi:hypothetical protein